MDTAQSIGTRQEYFSPLMNISLTVLVLSTSGLCSCTSCYLSIPFKPSDRLLTNGSPTSLAVLGRLQYFSTWKSGIQDSCAHVPAARRPCSTAHGLSSLIRQYPDRPSSMQVGLLPGVMDGRQGSENFARPHSHQRRPMPSSTISLCANPPDRRTASRKMAASLRAPAYANDGVPSS